jgi:MFS family permease
MTATRTGLGTSERIAIGIAAASGLLTAACISGLPSVQCTALAETYARAIGSFGSAALDALLASVALILFEKFERYRVLRWPFCALGFGLLSLATYLFIAGALAGALNLKAATKHCYFNSDPERAKQQIKLVGTDDWQIIFYKPWKDPLARHWSQ